VSRWGRYFTREIAVKRLAGRDEQGAGRYGGPERVKARVEHVRRETLTAEGQHVLSEILVTTAAPLKPGDLVTLNGVEWPIKSCYPAPGLSGETDHWEAAL
jgi:hypothetical protein